MVGILTKSIVSHEIETSSFILVCVMLSSSYFVNVNSVKFLFSCVVEAKKYIIRGAEINHIEKIKKMEDKK